MSQREVFRLGDRVRVDRLVSVVDPAHPDGLTVQDVPDSVEYRVVAADSDRDTAMIVTQRFMGDVFHFVPLSLLRRVEG